MRLDFDRVSLLAAREENRKAARRRTRARIRSLREQADRLERLLEGKTT